MMRNPLPKIDDSGVLVQFERDAGGTVQLGLESHEIEDVDKLGTF